MTELICTCDNPATTYRTAQRLASFALFLHRTQSRVGVREALEDNIKVVAHHLIVRHFLQI